MNFKVYLVNNKISKFYEQALREYEKRLGRYCKIKLFVIKNENLLAAKLHPRAYKIVIAAGGCLLSSEELAEKINAWAIQSQSEIAIIIGQETITGDEVLAVSPLQMAGALTATIVYEQIYRAYRINNNQPYHK